MELLNQFSELKKFVQMLEGQCGKQRRESSWINSEYYKINCIWYYNYFDTFMERKLNIQFD